MAGTKINNYSEGDKNLSSLMNSTDNQRRGYHAVSLTNWTNTNAPLISAGSTLEIGGALVEFQSDESISGTPTSGQNNYIIINSSAFTASWSTVAPVWNDEKQGYYSGTNRYLEYMVFVSGASYTKYRIADNSLLFIKYNGELDKTNLGNISTGSITSNGNLSTYSITSSGSLSTGTITSSGDLSTGSITSSGDLSTGSITSSGDLSTGVITSSGNLYTESIISSGNLSTGDIISSDIISSDIISTGTISSIGNLTTANISSGEINTNSSDIVMGGGNIYTQNGFINSGSGKIQTSTYFDGVRKVDRIAITTNHNDLYDSITGYFPTIGEYYSVSGVYSQDGSISYDIVAAKRVSTTRIDLMTTTIIGNVIAITDGSTTTLFYVNLYI